MLKYNEINPLNVFGLRRMAHCPPHFETLVFDIRTTDKTITDWVYENLAGRFYFGDHYYTTETKGVAMSKMIAFEDHSELSYFALFLDSINISSW
mgnify:CR=1 FL=1